MPNFRYSKYRISFELRSLRFGVLLCMCAYYAIIIFHLPSPTFLLRSPSKDGVLNFISMYLLVILIGTTGKFGLIMSANENDTTKKKILLSLIGTSYYLIAIGMSTAAIAFLASRLPSLFASNYWKWAHLFWVFLLLFIFEGVFALKMKLLGLYRWNVLDEMKALPLISPLFCLGSPSFFATNLKDANVPSVTIFIYCFIMYAAGIVFLLYLVIFSIFNHRYKTDLELENSASKLVDKDNKPLVARPRYRSENAPLTEKPVYIAFSLLGLGLYLIFVVLVDATISLAQRAVVG